MEITDEKLIADFLSGDEKSLDVIVERYLKSLLNFVFQFVGDKAVAEDIVQEVFIKTWKNIESFDGQKKFSTWIFAIAKNASIDWLKKKKSLPFSYFEKEDGDNILEYIEDGNILKNGEILLKMDNSEQVQEYLNSLDPKSRTIMLLHFNWGFSLVEIAEIMGSQKNTIKSRYRRALMSLKGKYFSEKELLENI